MPSREPSPERGQMHFPTIRLVDGKDFQDDRDVPGAIERHLAQIGINSASVLLCGYPAQPEQDQSQTGRTGFFAYTMDAYKDNAVYDATQTPFHYAYEAPGMQAVPTIDVYDASKVVGDAIGQYHTSDGASAESAIVARFIFDDPNTGAT